MFQHNGYICTLKLRIVHILMVLFSLSLVTDLVVSMVDNNPSIVVVDMDCDDTDTEDTEENQSNPQEIYQHHPRIINPNTLSILKVGRYVFSKSNSKESPELPPPDLS